MKTWLLMLGLVAVTVALQTAGFAGGSVSLPCCPPTPQCPCPPCC